MGAVLGLSEARGSLKNLEDLCDQLRLKRSRLLLVEDRQWGGQTRVATVEFVSALLEFLFVVVGVAVGPKIRRV